MIDKTVIIGTSPSLQGSRMGGYIDSFKYVIRFPYKGGWQTPPDWGTRTSYFCSTTWRALRRLNDFLPDEGYYIWSKHNEYIGPELKFLIKKFGGENVTGLIDKWQHRLPPLNTEDLTLTRYLSTGTAGVCIAAAKIGLPIVMLGCDWMKSGGGPMEDYVGTWYWEGDEQVPVDGFQLHHNWAAEVGLRDEMSKEYNVSMEFEGPKWQINQ